MRQQYFRDTRTNEIVSQFPIHEIEYFVKHQGPVETNHPCDIRCTSAKGPECNCSCGGLNHGKDWDAERGQSELF